LYQITCTVQALSVDNSRAGQIKEDKNEAHTSKLFFMYVLRHGQICHVHGQIISVAMLLCPPLLFHDTFEEKCQPSF
jgi:hypothetical protein